MKFDLKQFKFPIYISAALIILIAFSVFVRAQALGYGNEQGDEINTNDFIYEMKPGVDGVWNYLISQKRGPVQYLINMGNVALLGMRDEGQIRFPYMVFSVIAIYTLYRLTKKVFNPTAALVTATLMAINGLFIAFGRITQYQAVMYCFIPIGIMLFIHAIESGKNRILLYSGLVMSFAFLTHYDTLSVVPFFIAAFIGAFIREIYHDKKELNIGVLFRELRSNGKLLRKYLVKMLIFFAAFLLPALMYYVPFYFGKAFSDTTSDYLGNRLSGGGFMPRTDMTNTLLTLYIPEYHLNFLFLAGILGILLQIKNITGFNLGKINVSKKNARIIFAFFTLLILGATIFSFYPIKPRLSSFMVIGSSVIVSAFLALNIRVRWDRLAVITWFLGTYSFYFFIMKDPRTHVYVSILPLFLVAGYGIAKSYELIKSNLLKTLAIILVVLSFVFVSGVNWTIFVDKNPEYPWVDKSFLGWPIYTLKRVRYEKIEGVFGFNSYRGWEKIADLYNRGCLTGTFNSNEKDSISFFYIRKHQLKGDNKEFTPYGDNLIVVEGPHSWEFYNHEKIGPEYVLLGEIFSGDYPVTHIYGKTELYPNGEFLCKE